MGKQISGPILSEKAMLFNKQFSGNSDFNVSFGWLYNFKSRHGVHELEIHG